MDDARGVSRASPLRRLHCTPKAHLTLTLGVGGACAHLVHALYEVFSAEIFPLNLFFCCCTCPDAGCCAYTLKLSDLELPMVRLLPR